MNFLPKDILVKLVQTIRDDTIKEYYKIRSRIIVIPFELTWVDRASGVHYNGKTHSIDYYQFTKRELLYILTVMRENTHSYERKY